MRVSRWAVRAILLDPLDRLLLARYFDPENPARGQWWITIGGGVEPGEDPCTALHREIAEEVGIREVELGPLMWRRRSRFRFRGVTYEQDNDYYLARTPVTEVDDSGSDDGEREVTLGHRWWRMEELRITDQAVYPNGLATLLGTVLAEGPPPEPVVLDSDTEGGLD